MKTPKEYIDSFICENAFNGRHCVCERCKKGKETFLLERDIAKIQFQVFEWVVEQINENPKLAEERILIKGDAIFRQFIKEK